MDLKGLLDGVGDALTVKKVFGDPYQENGMTIIPVAYVRGGAGGGEGEQEEGGGSGGGFGLTARPQGVFVISGTRVDWKPAVDVNRIVTGAQVVAVIALLTIRTMLKRRTRR